MAFAKTAKTIAKIAKKSVISQLERINATLNPYF
jgi:hypothetical protein